MPDDPTTPRPPLDRRRALALLGGAGLGLALAACGGRGGSTSGASSTTGSSGSSSSSTAGTATGAAIPEETAGPYPGDGSNGPDILLRDGIVRSDITASLDGGTTVEGVPLTLALTLVDAATGGPLAGAALYVWHCDAEGRYSMYGDVADETFLRGVQEAGPDGTVTFASIFPAAYDGRWPHVHFEVYDDLATATSSGSMRATSQLAFPEDVCEVVYATDGYDRSAANLARTSLESDMVFADGHDLQLATVTGSVADGYTATLTVPV